jgi:hypothetical protein
MRSREEKGAAVHKGDKVRRNAPKFVSIAYLRGGAVRRGNQRSGGTYMFARGMRVISMTRGVGRKDIRMRNGNHLGSAPLFQESVLKLGVRSKIDVQWCSASSSLLLWIPSGISSKSGLYHLFAAAQIAFAWNKDSWCSKCPSCYG